MSEPRRRADEPRWPVVITVLGALFLVGVLPDRIRLVPAWVPVVFGVVWVTPMIAVALAPTRVRRLRVERATTFTLFTLTMVGTLLSLGFLVRFMIHRPAEIHGLELLTSSIGVWVNNVLMFSLLYWQLDRGGPSARGGPAMPRPDWLFPQEGAPLEDVPPGWKPAFVDYLFLSYSTATAFSTADVIPLTTRAKMSMMLESGISLVTIVVVAARAINVMGT